MSTQSQSHTQAAASPLHPFREGDFLDIASYERSRDEHRRAAIAARALRRVQLGPTATLTFESRETVRYQIHEMLRAERIVKPEAIAEEVATYAELLPDATSLSATLMLEFLPDERPARLAELVGLDRHIGVAVDGHPRVLARFDARQLDGDRPSSVQFLRFPLGPAERAALAAGAALRVIIDHPAWRFDAALPEATVRALLADMEQAAPAPSAPTTVAPVAPRSHDHEGSAMYPSPSRLAGTARAAVSATLNALLADGLDLHAQIKVAHWNIKGPHFAALHPLFETFAISLAAHNDTFAERAVTLGGRAYGTVRHVAAASRLPEYPQETTRDMEHVGLLAERIDLYLESLRASRGIAEDNGDTDTVDLVTGVISEFEKHGWFLRASLA